MKKFKNKIVAEGSQSLLKAFAEELEKLGYTQGPTNRLYVNDTKIVTPWGYDVNEPSYRYGYTTKGHYFNDDYKKYNLPQDWESALQAASELEEEKVKFEVGEYVWSDSGNVEKGKVLVGKLLTIDNFDETTPYKVTYQDGYIWCYNIRKATPQEIEAHLKSIWEARGFKIGSRVKRKTERIVSNNGCSFIHKNDLSVWNSELNKLALSTDIKIEGIKISKDNHSDILTLDQIKQIAEYFNKK